LHYSYQVKDLSYTYFRLRQTDLDGTTTSSSIITSSCQSTPDIKYWQTDANLYIQVPEGLNDKVCRLQVYNLIGQELKYIEFPYDGVSSLFTIPLTDFPSGVYPCKVLCGDKILGFKLMNN